MLQYIWNYEEHRLKTFWRILIQFGLFWLLISEVPQVVSPYIISDFYYELTSEVIFLLASVLTVLFSVKLIDKRNFVDLGLKINKKWFRDYFAGFLVGTSIFASIFLIEYLASWVTITGYFHTEINTSFITGFGLRFLGYTMVAFTEEIFCRGYQFNNLKEGFSEPGVNKTASIAMAWVVSSMIFGVLHVVNPHATTISILNLFIIGIFYGFTYIVSGSLAMPIGLHTAWNFVQGNVFGYSVSGFKPTLSVFNIESGGHSILSGAEFGPEAGLIILFGVALGFLIIYFRNKTKFGNFVFAINTLSSDKNKIFF